MKKKAVVSAVLAVLLILMPLQIMASTEPEGPIIYISGPDDILSLTEDDIIDGRHEQIARVQRSYWKEVTLMSVHEKKNPGWFDWPQTIYYTEKNPYAPGNANGTLRLQGFRRLGSAGSSWNVIYAGHLYYYVN